MADRRVPFSNEQLPIKEVEAYFVTTEKALRSFYQANNPDFTIKELNNELIQRIEELDKSTAFTILAAIEAHIRVDFLQRCYNKEKDPLSRKFRNLHKEKGDKVSFEDILELWKQHITKNLVISELRGALNYRHWLAHGRYWVVKLGRRYDFYSVLTLAINIQTELRIEMGA
jgi:hypothetical protein